MTSFCKGPLECRPPLQNKVCGIALQDAGATWLNSCTNFRQLLLLAVWVRVTCKGNKSLIAGWDVEHEDTPLNRFLSYLSTFQ